jgi:putative ABC transport system permease protein
VSAGVSWKGWRAVLRVAWRDARRRKGRTALVALMIAIPVAAVVAITTAAVSGRLPWSVLEQRRFGDADIRVNGYPGGFERSAWGDVPLADTDGIVADLVAKLPAGSEVVEVEHVTRFLLFDGWYQPVLVTNIPLTGMTADVYPLRSGRAPAASDEIVLSPALLRSLDGEVGESITLRFGTYTVTGTAVNPAYKGEPLAFLAPGTPIPQPATPPGREFGPFYGPRLFVRLPERLTGPDFSGLFSSSRLPDGVEVRLPIAGERMPLRSEEQLILTVGQSLGLFAMGIVVAAALAIGARRQLREHGLLLAQGADPSHVAAVVVTYGALCGLIGAVAGAAVGLGGAVAYFRTGLADRFSDELVGPVTWSPGATLVAIVLGVLAAALAAWRPAHQAASVPVLSSLAGRRPLPAVTATLPLKGLLIGAGGLAAIGVGVGSQTWQVIAFGGALVMLSCVVCSPAIVSLLERLSGGRRTLTRLAWRDLARQRGRVAPVVAAITVVAALLLTGATLATSDRAGWSDRRQGPSDLVRLSEYTEDRTGASGLTAEEIQRVRSLLDVVAEVPFVTTPGWVDGSPFVVGGDLVQAGPELLDLLGVTDPAASEALRSGRPVVFGRASDLPVVARFWSDTDPAGMPTEIDLDDAVFVAPARSTHVHPGAIVPPGFVDLPALPDFNTGLFLRTSTPIDGPLADRLFDLNQELGGQANDPEAGTPANRRYVALSYVFPGSPDRLDGPMLIALGVAALAVLGVVALGLALTTNESRGDLATLAALGAGPRTRRRIVGTQAMTMTALGTWMAVPAGLLPAIVAWRSQRGSQDGWFVYGADTISRTVDVPWLLVAAVVLALPVLAGLTAAAFTRSIPARLDDRRV